jgi:hypothetical protein
VSSPRELGWRPAQTVFRGHEADDRPRWRLGMNGHGDAAVRAALQVR